MPDAVRTMNGKQSLYSFVHTPKPLGSVVAETAGLFNEVFKNQNFKGTLDRIVMELEIRQGFARARDTAFGNTYAAAGMAWGMLMVYKAFGPKKFLWRRTSGIVAYVSTVMLPTDFSKSVMKPEELVDFAVSEAQQLAEKYNLTVQLIYHGHPAYAGKYLHQQSQTLR